MKITTAHAKALGLHLGDVLGLDPEKGRELLVAMAGEDPTYGELAGVNLDVLSHGLMDCKIKVPPTRRVPLVALFKAFGPDLPVCETCGRFPLTLQDIAWVSVGETCPKDNGLFNQVRREVVLAWTDRQEYPAGTTHDANRVPITDVAVQAARGQPHPWIVEGLKAEGRSITDLLGLLVRSAAAPTPAQALKILTDPTSVFVDATEVRTFLRTAGSGRAWAALEPAPRGFGPSPESPVPAIQRLSGADFRTLSAALASAFPRRSALDQLMSFELNTNLNTITGEGTLLQVIQDILTWAQSHGTLGKLVAGARRQNPGNEALRAAVEALTPPVGTLEGRALRTRLAELYPSTAKARLVASDAGLIVTQIDFSGTAEDVWFSILREAKNQGQVDLLLQIVRREYPHAGV